MLQGRFVYLMDTFGATSVVYFSIMASAVGGYCSAGPQAISQNSRFTGSALSALADAEASPDGAELAELSAAG